MTTDTQNQARRKEPRCLGSDRLGRRDRANAHDERSQLRSTQMHKLQGFTLKSLASDGDERSQFAVAWPFSRGCAEACGLLESRTLPDSASGAAVSSSRAAVRSLIRDRIFDEQTQNAACRKS